MGMHLGEESTVRWVGKLRIGLVAIKALTT
jgi:hypothetical protein